MARLSGGTAWIPFSYAPSRIIGRFDEQRVVSVFAALQAGGRRFEPGTLHWPTASTSKVILSILRTDQYSRPASTSGLRPHAKVVSYQPVMGVSVVPYRDECTIHPLPT
jgi:hypothetical protein